MSTVILVGAGATRAEAEASGSGPGLKPPLDSDFFRLCGEIRNCNRRFDKFARRVTKYTEFRLSIDPFSGNWGMEEIFNYIYFDAHSRRPPEGSLEAYDALVRIYQSAIAKSTEDLECTSGHGVCALSRSLCKAQGGQSPLLFVTFNQDLVIENSLAALCGEDLGISWSIRKTYRMSFKGFRKVGRNPRPFPSCGNDSVPVIKLHGSLNWVYPVPDSDKPRKELLNPKGSPLCVDHKRPRTGFTDGRQDMMPVIVPPILDKSRRYGELLEPLWTEAHRLLAEAERVIIFGYSFPEADVRSRVLFRSALCRETTLKEIVVINPDRSVVSRVARLVSNVPIRPCVDVPEYLGSLQ